MRIALFQGPERSGDTAHNLRRLDEAAREASARDARLLICPEMSVTGYNIGPAAVGRLAEPADGPIARQVQGIAHRNGLAVLYGYPERAGEAVYNAVRLVDRDGRHLAGYRKAHLYGEVDRAAFSPGDAGFTQTTLDGVRIGLLICYDVEFPEAVRAHALAGADLIAVPTALMRPYEVVARAVVPARAFENQVYVAYANRCDVEGELDYCGESCLVAPDGGVLVRAGAGEELLVADIDLAGLRASREAGGHLRDRRPELYGALTTPMGGGRTPMGGRRTPMGGRRTPDGAGSHPDGPAARPEEPPR